MTHGTYNPLLVVVSVGIAIFASYTALTLANRVAVTSGRARAAWLGGGSLAMGFGIWSMHFIGMLAFSVPGMSVVYDVPLLIISVLVAIIASALALYVVSRREIRRDALAAAGLAMAAAICGMHYIGIAGMRMPARVVWNYSLVAASIAIAIVAAYVALWLAYRLRERRSQTLLLPAASVMGIAISGMHYTGMAAMRFVPLREPMVITDQDLFVTGGLAVAVAMSTLLILSIALISSIAQRALERQAALAADHARLFVAADQRAAEEEALRRVTEELAGAFEIDHVLERIMHSAREATQSDSAFVERVDPDLSEITVAASEGEGAPVAGTQMPYSGSYAEQVAGRGEPLLVNGPEDARSLRIVVPLGEGAMPVGALVLVRSSGREPFRQDEKRRAHTFSHLALLAFRRIHLLEEAERRREQLAAAERLGGLGRLASTMAHEFNNVLMSIQAFSEATRRIGTFEHYLKTAPEIDRAIQRGKAVTEAVLRLTRATRPSLQPFDLSAWLSLLERDLGSLLPPNITVAVHCESDLHVRADQRHLEQVIVNLALNARDAMPAGGRLLISASRHGPDVARLTISDTGRGMTDEELKKIFEPLYTTKKGGTGLGLAIVHEIIRAHGGTIEVRSDPEKGTRFDITLQAAPAPGDEATAGEREMTSGVRRVLLVEDDDAVASGMKLLMELAGVEVKRVALGREAVPAIAEWRPDVVILDVGLPDLDGFVVYELIESAAPGMPVVFATGHADEARLAPMSHLPHVGFLRKPFHSDELLAAIDRAASRPS